MTSSQVSVQRMWLSKRKGTLTQIEFSVVSIGITKINQIRVPLFFRNILGQQEDHLITRDYVVSQRLGFGR